MWMGEEEVRGERRSREGMGVNGDGDGTGWDGMGVNGYGTGWDGMGREERRDGWREGEGVTAERRHGGMMRVVERGWIEERRKKDER